MKVLLFGATGMIGQGVLRECLLDAGITEVTTVGRSRVGTQHPKLRDLLMADFASLDLTSFDACFFCLGVSSAGMKEPEYRKITFDLTLSVARPLAAANPKMVFIYVSGQGTGSRNMMWSKVKGATENALLELPFQAYMMRPGFIQPMHGIQSKTFLYRVFYKIGTPLFPLLRKFFPKNLTTTEEMGLAMIAVARAGAPKRILEGSDINQLARHAS
ncbi:epimerase [Rhizocola hellebori]|uniref:Epimerase n=1 Tax=Rhizocola hellebori TaxID=1392758 RepID=A0A8J3Q9T8_9ACTN|nr:epimerase [Rhizocola hellebori]GIH05813.1 epimerase [Rhizocola hellebori]